MGRNGGMGSYTKLELVILCSSIVKILSTHVIECILPALIDAVGILPVLHAEIKLREKSAQGRTTSQRSPEDPSDSVCSVIEGVVTQIKEAMKQTLMTFSSVKTPAKSHKAKSVKRNVDPVGETASDCSLIDGLTASSTNSIITEIIRLCCPDISHKITKGKEPDQPVSFRQVINSIVKAMEHIDSVRRCASTSDVLGESDDEKSTISDGSEESIFSQQIRRKAVHTISDILLEAGEKIASAGSPHSNNGSSAGPLDEITIMASSIRVRPTASEITKTFLKDLKKQASSDQTTSDSTKPIFSRNRFLSAACKTYRCVQKTVFLFLLKVQASASPEEEPRATSGESETLKSGNSDASSSKLSSEHVNPSMMNVVKGSSSSVCDKEQLSLDMCTDEVISKILGAYRKQAQKLTSDHFQSTCTQLVRDVLVKKVQMLHTGKNPRKIVRSHSSDVPLRKLSRDLIKYLDSAALEITQSVSRELKECLEDLSRNETQTGSSRVSSKSALDYANVLAPFRLFRHVRNMIKNTFSTVNDARQSNISVGTTSGYDETSFEPVTEILIREDGTIVKKSSWDHEGFSRGFAQRQSRIANSAINQLKSVLSSNSTMQHHALVITNAISTILRNMTEAPNIGRRFSESVLMEAFSHNRVFGARGISPLVHSFVLEFIKHLVHYLSSTESAFLQMAVQTELLTFHTLTPDPEKAITVALSELRKSLTYFVVKSTDTSATPINGMPSAQNMNTLDELNAHSQESQFSVLDNECSCPSVGRSAGRRRRIAIHFTVGKEASWISDPEKSEKSKNGSCPAGHQEIHSWDELNGNNDWLGETAASCLRRKFAPFSSAMRKLFKSR
ncbi:uncharacterized protein LOC117596263 [Pangasianodon hypophthalmus]|uniref:uncharacterized protein LOC117596263 n=1 Tax=Pangasianodon hypophthalmus TaxID=310915 RepID=UPI00230828A6|nr:uncharacterized protein LOC117596263 [Pangasianodon hypophthalmus]